MSSKSKSNKKRKEPPPGQLRKAEKYLDKANFDALVDELVAANQIKYQSLLKTKEGWRISQEVKDHFFGANEALALRFMHRCSLFAMHRTDTKPETMKKAKVALREDDVTMAWTTLKMDEQQT